VHVPPELAAFAADPKFQQILLRVKEQTMVNFIALNRMSDDFVESITIDATSKESAQLARNLIETHLKLQMKVKAAENRLLRVQTDLFSTQGEIASGQMVEFMVPSDLIGLVIGKKGSRIKQIESETNVTSINVRDNGHIMIYGPDSASVQAAREQLELMDDSFPVSPAQADWLANKNNSSIILDLKTSANLIIVKINREKSSLEVVGIRPAVQMAKFLLDTQLEYVDREIEIEANEREAREKLVAVRKQVSLYLSLFPSHNSTCAFS
jgi:predicted PilT family ATPase